MNALSLCSGIGGIERGLKRVITDYRTVAYCEADPFCQDVLIRRAEDGWLDRAPIWPDLRTFDGRPWRGRVDLVHAGVPCQPFSVAGTRRGAADARNLWPDVRRVIAESEPAVVFLENVPGAMPYFYHVVLPELSGLGYATQAGLFTAAEVGAPHRRQRVFVLARMADTRECGTHETAASRTDGAEGIAAPRSSRVGDVDGRRDAVGHADEPRLAIRLQPEIGCRDLRDEGPPAWPPGPSERDRWAAVLARWPDLAPATVADAVCGRRRTSGQRGRMAPIQGRESDNASSASQSGSLADATGGHTRRPRRGRDARRSAEGDETQPALRRVADGTPSRVDRLRALGNAVVPACAALAWVMLTRQLCDTIMPVTPC